MKKIFLIAGLLILVTAIVLLNYNYQNKKTPQVTINNHIFNLAIAKTDTEKKIGLSKYRNIPQNFGMLFPFGKPDYYSFWMKNMKFPIDIIFIRNNKIVTIFKNASPPKSNNELLPIYRNQNLSDTVLEINTGLSDKYNFKTGDLVKINY
jgi:uncharacterized membrane protein (UPF0127 family)